MKKILLVSLIFVVLCIPTQSHAATTQDTYRAVLLELIELLNKQIQLLTEQLVSQTSTQRVSTSITVLRTVPRASELMSSQYYSGVYTGIYITNGRTLSSVGTTKLHNAHQLLWDRFVDIVGERYAREHIREFRLYSRENAEYDAFTERDANTGEWIVGVNTFELDLARESDMHMLDELYLHEVGHMFIDDHEDLLTEFETTFWDSADMAHAERVAQMTYGTRRDAVVADYYDAHESDFVSEYAATSPLEDAVESFVHFVLDKADSGIHEKASKLRFFNRYSFFTQERERISPIIHN